MLMVTAPPGAATDIYGESIDGAYGHARERLSVLRAHRAGLRGPAPVSALRLPSGPGGHPPLRLPRRGTARDRVRLEQGRSPKAAHRVQHRDLLGFPQLLHRDRALGEHAVGD